MLTLGPNHRLPTALQVSPHQHVARLHTLAVLCDQQGETADCAIKGIPVFWEIRAVHCKFPVYLMKLHSVKIATTSPSTASVDASPHASRALHISHLGNPINHHRQRPRERHLLSSREILHPTRPVVIRAGGRIVRHLVHAPKAAVHRVNAASRIVAGAAPGEWDG